MALVVSFNDSSYEFSSIKLPSFDRNYKIGIRSKKMIYHSKCITIIVNNKNGNILKFTCNKNNNNYNTLVCKDTIHRN